MIILKSKREGDIGDALNSFFKDKLIEEFITDNGKDFCNKVVKKILFENRIVHKTVSVELHRSNSRVERIIRIIREFSAKYKSGDLEKRDQEIENTYNYTFHSGSGVHLMKRLQTF